MEKITKKERLFIAVQLLSGLQAPSYLPERQHIKQSAKAALDSADTIIALAGFVVENAAPVAPTYAAYDMD